MKKITYIFLLFVGFIQAQIVNIPDANFKAKLLEASTSNSIAQNGLGQNIKIDINDDGEIQESEALLVRSLNVRNSSIQSLDGIEAFLNIRVLNCGINQLTSLDVTQNINLNDLECISNQLTSLDVTQNIFLEYLNCRGNQLTSLDVMQNTDLGYLDCFGNQLTSLDVTQNIYLEHLDCSSNQLTSLDVTQNINLGFLFCDDNQLTSLDVTQNINLGFIFCDDNQLTSLDVTQNMNLYAFSCSSNQLTSLDVTQNTDLEYLRCDDNQLTSLDVTQNKNLSGFICSSNQLTSLDVTQNIGLYGLLCDFNQLTNLDVTQNTDLEFLYCSDNQLTSLDLTQNSNLNDLICHNNFLVYLLIKNNTQQSWSNLAFWGNSNLEYICADEEDIALVQQLINQYGYTNCHVNSYCSFTPSGNYNTITGNVRLDNDNNGCDVTDYSIPFFRLDVDLNAMNTNSSVFSNNNGVYNLYTNTIGVYSLSPVLENPAYFSVSPQPGTAIINQIDNSSTSLDFCITTNGIHPDLEVVVMPIIPAQPGFEAVYKIVYKNKGNQVMSQVNGLGFTYNSNLMQFVSSTVVPSQTTSGSLQWSYANLMPFESKSIIVTMQINPPTHPTHPVNLDDVLVFTSTILPTDNDEIVSDNTFILNQTVVGSYDPNDITCLQGDLVAPELIGEFLHYMIRFENTGTAPATFVVVKVDINETQFEVNSLQLLSASHPVDVRLNGSILEFIFQNIQLESGGHGNILMKMRTKSNLQVGDTVDKKANIFFDYNFPIETNEAETMFQALSISNPVLDNLITVYPNPVKDIVNIAIKDNSTIKTIELFDSLGRLLQTQMVNDSASEINMSSRAEGIYFIRIHSDKGTKVGKLVKE